MTNGPRFGTRFATAALLGVIGVAALDQGRPALAATLMAQANTACNIKGNVNTQGERIYHVPGQRYYDETRISPSHGERWFCSEQEAREAGWRRAKV